MSSSTAEPQKKLNKGRLAAFAFGNFGQALSYNALSTYFMVFATNALFAGVDKTTAADMTRPTSPPSRASPSGCRWHSSSSAF
ncbi:hypothetical protein [Bifidobacterium breve]|uniref:hypothetical protein n=1 Tax=Bifidobacterium breve TaxID=1685 RepID=UPI0021C89012|nr:hypothetical protein [Bifidobacterium breve]